VLAISVLGPVELRRDAQPVPVPAGKTTEVLIRLAPDAAETISVDQMIADLWGIGAATTARNTVQAKISNLRRVLGNAAQLSGGSSGYTLEVDPSVVDAAEVHYAVPQPIRPLHLRPARGAARPGKRRPLSRIRGRRTRRSISTGAGLTAESHRRCETRPAWISPELSDFLGLDLTGRALLLGLSLHR
jgi:hypothetical protein